MFTPPPSFNVGEIFKRAQTGFILHARCTPALARFQRYFFVDLFWGGGSRQISFTITSRSSRLNKVQQNERCFFNDLPGRHHENRGYEMRHVGPTGPYEVHGKMVSGYIKYLTLRCKLCASCVSVGWPCKSMWSLGARGPGSESLHPRYS